MPADADAFLPLAPRDLLILLALAAEDRHGYAVVQAVEAESDGRVLLDPANLYRALKRLGRDGLVTETDAAHGSDRRRVYRITGLGRDVLRGETVRLERLTATARELGLLPASRRDGRRPETAS